MLKRVLFVLVTMLLVAVAPACDEFDSSDGPISVTHPPSPTPLDGENPPGGQQGQVDLQITTAYFEQSNTAAFGYIVKIIVRNNGNTGTGFDAVCNWSCPGGTIITSGMSFGGMYIDAGQEREYSPNFTAKVCDPLAAIVQNFECTIDPDNEVQETNEGNNTWFSSQLSVPS